MLHYSAGTRQSAEENAKTQSHLVEVLTGVQTVKAQNVEMVSRWKWQELYAKYIARTFEKTVTGTALSETSQVLQKLCSCWSSGWVQRLCSKVSSPWAS